ncbi:MAG: PAS domain S-box protein [Candidatus Margulisiibacteriota bacterium]
MNKPDLASVVENIRDIAYVSALDGEISYINQRVTEYGYQPQDIVGHNLAEFVHPDDLARVRKEMEKMLVSGRDFPTVLRLRKRDGAYVDVEDLSRTVVKENGETMIIGTIRDISERRQLEDEMRMALKSMINAFVIFDSVFDAAGKFISYRFVYINDAYERITGVKNEEVKGKTVQEVWPKTEPEWIKRYGEVAVTGVTQTFDLYHDPTKKLYHCVVYRPSETKDRFCVIFEDITERQRADQQLKEHIEELEVFHHATVGRELKMIELEQEVNKLLTELGRETKYK